jgi:hypothetical protein
MLVENKNEIEKSAVSLSVAAADFLPEQDTLFFI